MANRYDPKYQVMTLRQLAKMMGVPENEVELKKFRAKLLARDADCGGKMLIKHGSSGSGVRYSTTLAMMRTHFPELFDTTTEVTVAVNERFEDIEEKICDMIKKNNAMARKVRENSIQIKNILSFLESSSVR